MSQATRSTENAERDSLELDRETVQDLSSGEAEQAVGPRPPDAIPPEGRDRPGAASPGRPRAAHQGFTWQAVPWEPTGTCGQVHVGA